MQIAECNKSIWRADVALRSVLPLVLAKPLAHQIWPNNVVAARSAELSSPPFLVAFVAVAIAGAAWASTLSFMSHHNFSFVNS